MDTPSVGRGNRFGSDEAKRLHQAPDRVLEGDTERSREPPQRQDGHVVLTPLDAADVGTMNPRLERQFFLRPAPFFADLPQVLTEPDKRRVFLSCHTLKVRSRRLDIDIV